MSILNSPDHAYEKVKQVVNEKVSRIAVQFNVVVSRQRLRINYTPRTHHKQAPVSQILRDKGKQLLRMRQGNDAVTLSVNEGYRTVDVFNLS